MTELEARIKAAQHEFMCAVTPEEKRHKWRKMRELIMRSRPADTRVPVTDSDPGEH